MNIRDTSNSTTTALITGDNCLTNSNFCLNGARCGLNGNCICAKFFYGSNCENSIAKDKRVTLIEKGIGQERVVLITTMFLLVLPVLAYFFTACCIKTCSEDDESMETCCADTFFCLPNCLRCMKGQ